MLHRVLGALSLMLAVLSLLISPATLRAQSIQSSILGTVTDSSGAVVPGATVNITDTDTNVTRTVTTNSQGDYQLLNILAGNYRVEISRQGFQTVVLNDLTLTARQQLRANATLPIGQVSQQIKVNAGNVGVIATDTPSIHSTLSSVAVRDLPANYRASTSGTSPLKIIQVLPGVQADNSGQISVQGGSPFATEVSVDGLTIQSANGNSPLANAMPSGDSISEIRVDGVLNNAEFGQPGEVTSITKSGTNNLHGAIFWYHQESSFDATPWGSVVKPKIDTNDFGVTGGGPVVLPHIYNGHNRTFFFSTYEGYRGPRQSPQQYTVPTAEMKQGNFSHVTGVQPLTDPFTGGIYPNYTVPINPVAQKFLQFFPDPNIGNTTVFNPGEINYVANKDESLNSNQFDVRVDQYLGAKALVFGRFTWKKGTQLNPQDLDVPSSSNITSDKVFVAALNYGFTPSLEDQFRVGFTRQESGNTNSFNGTAFTKASGLQGLQNLYYNGLSELDFNFLTNLDADRLQSITTSHILVFSDSLNWTKGNHTMKFGVEITHPQTKTPLGFFGADNYGTFDYSEAKFTGQEFADFLIGAPNNTSYDVVQSDNDGMSIYYAGYAQDQWKVTPRLTLSYGIRYQLHPGYHDASGNIGNFDPSVPKSGRVIYPTGKESLLSIPYLESFNYCGIGKSTGAPDQNGAPCTPVLSNAQAKLPAGLRNYPKTRFYPRFGFAYRLFNNDKTVLRGGFGMYGITLMGSNFYSLTGTLQANTQNYSNSLTPTGPDYVWPQIFAGSGTSSSAASYGQAYFGTANDINWKDPYAEQFALTLSRDLGRGYGAQLSYIGMVSHHLVFAPELNALDYSSTISAYDQPLSARPFPNWGTINTRSTQAGANYQSMQFEMWHRFSTGLTFNSTYTWAKNLSDNQGPNNTSYAGQTGGGRASWRIPQIDRGQVNGTRRNRWITTMVYQIPVGTGQHFGGGMGRLANLVVGGWQLSNILLFQGGPYLTAYFPSGQGDPSGTGSGLNSGKFGSLPGRSQKVDRVADPAAKDQNRTNWINRSAFVCPGDPTWKLETACHTGGGQVRTVDGQSVPDPLPIGRFGNEQIGTIEGPGQFNLSTGLAKEFKIREGMNLRLEGTFTNVINHTNLGNPNTNVSSTQFGVITSTDGADFGGNRTGQVSARLVF